MDAQRRRHQCATIQLDFQLPLRFDLTYRSGGSVEDQAKMERPVIIHRAILGSVERMIAILTENYAGRWPFWLSPRQAVVVPVSHASDAYAAKVASAIHDAGFYVETDLSDVTFNKKIRNAQVSHANFIFVVGQQEQDTNTVNARKASHEEKDVTLTIEEAIARLDHFKKTRSKTFFL